MKTLQLTHSLSIRETQILNLISFGKTATEIASELFISPHTVISHRKNLLVKLKAKNKTSLVRKGFEQGILRLQNIEVH